MYIREEGLHVYKGGRTSCILGRKDLMFIREEGLHVYKGGRTSCI